MILENGKFPSIYDGHHIKSVKIAIDGKDYASIADPNNIIIGQRAEHFEVWHKGNWLNQSDSVVVNNVRITSINRDALIKKLLKALGGK